MLNFTNHVKKYPYIIHTEYFNTIYKTRIREWVQRSENKGPFGLLVWNMIPHTHTLTKRFPLRPPNMISLHTSLLQEIYN